MRKLTIVIFSLIFIIAACGNNKVNKDAAEIPVKWAEAMIQRDDATRVALLVNYTPALDASAGPENEEELGSYGLTQWKSSDKKYYYKINFIDPITEKGKTERMEIVKTKEGWKRTKFGNLENFDTLTEGLTPVVIKELHEE